MCTTAKYNLEVYMFENANNLHHKQIINPCPWIVT